MATVTVNDASLSAIAGAIREKLDVETTYKPSEMAAAIGSIETGGTDLTSADEGKVVVESSGEYVLQAQTSRSVSSNGTYDTTTNNEVVVSVSGGMPTFTEQQWSALSDDQKLSYGLVAIIQSNDGYTRGVLVYGMDYPAGGLPYSDQSHVACIADFAKFDASALTWGTGSSPVLLSKNVSRYMQEEAVLINGLSDNPEARIELDSTTSDFTMYVVAKGIAYADGDVQVLGSVAEWNSGRMVNVYHRSGTGTIWRSSVYGNDQDLIDTNGDYVAIAIRSSNDSGTLKASWFASNGSSRINVNYRNHGVLFTFGYRQGVPSADLAVKFIGYVDAAESDETIQNNLQALMAKYGIA